MKKVCFLASHLHSGASVLFEILRQNPRIEGYDFRKACNHPLVLEDLTSRPHKCHNSAAVYLTELNHNYLFCCKSLYQLCRFVYVIREPRATLNLLVASDLYDEGSATRYYCYRLRRLAEMAKRTPGAVMTTWDDMTTGKIHPFIEQYLGLRQPLMLLPYSNAQPASNLIGRDNLEWAQDCYERHLYFLKQQNLVHAM